MAKPLLTAYLSAWLALSAYLVLGALARGVPATWVAVWVAELALLAAAPRWPLLAVASYLLMQYGVSSHGSLHDILLSMRMVDGVAGLTLAAWALWRRSTSAVRVPMPRMAVALFGWIAICIAVAVADGLPYGLFARHDPSAFFQAAVLLVVVADTLRTRREMAWVSLLLASIVIARAVLQAPGGIHLESYLATLAVVCIPLVLIGATTSPDISRRAVFWLLATALAVVLVIGQNRAAAVAAAAAVLVFALQTAWRPQRPRRAVLALPVVLLAIAAWLLSSDYAARFRSLWDAQNHAGATLDRATASERLTLWRAGWDMAIDHPVFGVGPGNYPVMLSMYRPGMDPLAAHSNYVQMLAETGFVGLTLYLAVFGSLLVALGRAARDSEAAPVARLLQVSLVAYLAGGAFNSRHDFVLAYVIAGWACAVAAASRRKA